MKEKITKRTDVDDSLRSSLRQQIKEFIKMHVVSTAIIIILLVLIILKFGFGIVII